MILIADSGSTKCDWLLIDPQGTHLRSFSTMGFNPYFHSTAFVSQQLAEHDVVKEIVSQTEHVFFYGAGASTPNLCKVISEALKSTFPGAKVHVDHDLVGAVYAVYQGEPCIASILGTGSNSCYFDGKTVFEEVPALAYILGDEGSGSWFGKELLRAYFYKQLPHNMMQDFKESYTLSKDDLVKYLYNNPHANVWLAGFMPFIGKHRFEPIVKEWLHRGLKAFVHTHVTCFERYKELKTHFVGSIAHYFNEELQAVCDEEGVNMGSVVKKPILTLADYHVTYLIPQLL